MRALIIEKRVQNLKRLTTCSSYTQYHAPRSLSTQVRPVSSGVWVCVRVRAPRAQMDFSLW